MKRSPGFAAALSVLAPGLGQMYGGEGSRGAAILFCGVVIANLNIIILPLIALANPLHPAKAPDERTIWAYRIPRVVHDITALWSVIFWIWAVLDAYSVASRDER